MFHFGTIPQILSLGGAHHVIEIENIHQSRRFTRSSLHDPAEFAEWNYTNIVERDSALGKPALDLSIREAFIVQQLKDQLALGRTLQEAKLPFFALFEESEIDRAIEAFKVADDRFKSAKEISTLHDQPNFSRCLRQLSLMGVFDEISCLIVGKPEFYDQQDAPFNYDALFEEVIGPRDYPIVSNFDCGHTNPMLTVPRYARSRLQANASGVEFDYLKVRSANLEYLTKTTDLR